MDGIAIGRATPAFLGLFALVTLLAYPMMTNAPQGIRQAAWYRKTAPTFSDALVRMRREMWAYQAFCKSGVGGRDGASSAHPHGTLD